MNNPKAESSSHASRQLSFRFLDLGPDICYHILGYTDLVAPLRFISCCLHRQALRLSAPRVPEPGLPAYPLHDPDSVRPDDHRCNEPPLPPCYQQWMPPTAMFLTSRSFSVLAQSVFLSQNHFHMCPVLDFGRGSSNLDRNIAADFLSSPMRSEHLSRITSLGVHLSQTYVDPVATSPGLRQWYETIEKFRDSLNPRRLYLHIPNCNSIPIVKKLLTHPYEFPRSFLDQPAAIDVIRESVDMFWPIERLALPGGVQMFLWDLDLGVEGDKLIYYCRHRSEPLPRKVEDMDLNWPLHPAVVHVERTFERHGPGNKNGDSGTEPGGYVELTPQWVEGIIARPGCEDESWFLESEAAE